MDINDCNNVAWTLGTEFTVGNLPRATVERGTMNVSRYAFYK